MLWFLNDWISFKSISIKRRLVHETAFDGAVKIFNLEADDARLNSLLTNKYFGDFIHTAENGIFLRMFRGKHSWPRTTLIYIDFTEFEIKEIKKTSSSWDVWIGTNLGNGNHSIEIKPTEKIICKL